MIHWRSIQYKHSSFRKVCPSGRLVQALEFKEQWGYGLVDLHMDCGDGVNRIFLANSGGGANVQASCTTPENLGFKSVQAREQWGYGIINAYMKCNGDGASWTASNTNMAGWWNDVQSCPEGYVITGFDVREQHGHGIINFRFRCSQLL